MERIADHKTDKSQLQKRAGAIISIEVMLTATMTVKFQGINNSSYKNFNVINDKKNKTETNSNVVNLYLCLSFYFEVKRDWEPVSTARINKCWEPYRTLH